MEDNRKSPRCSIHWRCALVTDDHGRPETIQCRTCDISSTGVSIVCHRNISPPKAVTVYLLLDPGDEAHPQVVVEIQGEIRNNVFSGQQGGFRLGIQFSKFAGNGKQVLQKYLPKELVQTARVVTAPAAAPIAVSNPPIAAAPAAEAKPEEAVTTAAAATPDEAQASGPAQAPEQA